MSLTTPGEDVTLQELFKVALSRRRSLFFTTAAAAVISGAIAFSLPVWYSSQAILLPPQDDSSGLTAMVGAQLGGLAALAGGSDSPGERYISIMKSEMVMSQVVAASGLKERFAHKKKEELFDELQRHSRLTFGKKDGLIFISVEDQDPKKAALIANAYVDALGNTLAQANAQASGRDRSYIEQRLAQAREALTRAEAALNRFQKGNRALLVPDQAAAAIGSVATLQAQITQKEVELAGLRRLFRDDAPEIRAAQAGLTSLRAQMSKLEGTGGIAGTPGVAALPDLSREYVGLMRECKVREAVVEALVKQFESSSLTEGRHESSLRVIQKALPAERKSRPSRMAIMGLFTMAGFAAAMVRIFVTHLLARQRQEQR